MSKDTNDQITVAVKNIVNDNSQNEVIDVPINIFSYLEQDKSISQNTKKNYKKHLNVLANNCDFSFNQINEKIVQDNILQYICVNYNNLNTRISYLSVFKYILKAFDTDDLCGLHDCFQLSRRDLSKHKAMTNKSGLQPIQKAIDIWDECMNKRIH